MSNILLAVVVTVKLLEKWEEKNTKKSHMPPTEVSDRNSHLCLLDELYHITVFMEVTEFKLKQEKNQTIQCFYLYSPDQKAISEILLHQNRLCFLLQ